MVLRPRCSLLSSLTAHRPREDLSSQAQARSYKWFLKRRLIDFISSLFLLYFSLEENGERREGERVGMYCLLPSKFFFIFVDVIMMLCLMLHASKKI